jgi:hypothetical protein
VAFGLITRRLEDPQPILAFLHNAEEHGHRIDRCIVAHSHGVRPESLRALRERARVDTVTAHGDPNLRTQLERRGLQPAAIQALLEVPSWVRHREVPYGAYRNAVLLHALLEGIDQLIFFDSDVRPRVLHDLTGDQPVWVEVDFAGTHLRYLGDARVAATTSDYSGYYIIPPMRFPGLEELLYGLGKGMALEYMADCREHHCLNFGPAQPGEAQPTQKPLGGNLGLSLDRPESLAPFYSTTYVYQGRCIRGRGEDTLLGQALGARDRRVLDIDLRVFHDTYAGFPEIPDIRRQAIRDRFHYACLGWIGRNPFLTWFLHRHGRLPRPFEEELGAQRQGLKRGGPRAAKALGDDRFSALPSAFETAVQALPGSIKGYKRLMKGWHALIATLPDPSSRAGQAPSESRAERFTDTDPT